MDSAVVEHEQPSQDIRKVQIEEHLFLASSSESQPGNELPPQIETIAGTAHVSSPPAPVQSAERAFSIQCDDEQGGSLLSWNMFLQVLL